MWGWFAERLRNLEEKLRDLGGYDEDLADRIEEHGFFGPTALVERHEESENCCYDIEDVAAAFYVTLQPRLNAVKVSAGRVYQDGAELDGIGIATPKDIIAGDLQAAWHLANYVKHSDEWGPTLDWRQRPTFAVLEDLGVASIVGTDRSIARLPILKATCRLTDEGWLADGVHAVVSRCRSGGNDLLQRIQDDFAAFTGDIEVARQRNVAKLKAESTA